MAGGKGTRLKPFTTCIPKPLVPIKDTPIIEILIKDLKNDGFTDIIICVNHMASLIQAFCGDGSKFGVNITYSFEDSPLGTIGPLSNIDYLEDDFLVVNGDTLTDLKFSDIYSYHVNNKSNITVGTTIRRQQIDFGVINREQKAGSVIIKSFEEKPELSIEVAMGVNVFNRHILFDYFNEIHKNSGSYYCGLDTLIKDYLENNVEILKYNFDGFWLDIGRPPDYDLANSL